MSMLEMFVCQRTANTQFCQILLRLKISLLQRELHAFVQEDDSLAAWTAMLYVFTGIHTERNQTTRPDPL